MNLKKSLFVVKLMPDDFDKIDENEIRVKPLVVPDFECDKEIPAHVQKAIQNSNLSDYDKDLLTMQRKIARQLDFLVSTLVVHNDIMRYIEIEQLKLKKWKSFVWSKLSVVFAVCAIAGTVLIQDWVRKNFIRSPQGQVQTAPVAPNTTAKASP